MKNYKIGERLSELFKRNRNKPLSYNEIVGELNLTKKEKAVLSETLNELVSEGMLSKKSRKFWPVVSKPEPEEPIKEQANPKLLEGIFDATPLAKNLSYAFVRTEKGDFFIGAEDTLNAYHGDRVEIDPRFRSGKADRGYVRKIVKRANEIMAGDIRFSGKRKIFISGSQKIHNWFEVQDTLQAKEGEKVVLQVTNWGSPIMGKMPSGNVIEILGPSGDPQVELLAVIRQYQLPLEFPDDVLAEVEGIKTKISQKDRTGRLDLRETYTFTIDPASAKDFDDAISIETTSKGWRLSVHIADVSHYVKPGSAIFKEATKRGNSFYFPKKVIPMLPELLSNQVCSLRPDEEKLTLSVITEFDRQGKNLSQKMAETIVKSDFRLSYEQVDALYDGEETELPSQLVQALNEARKLSALLSQNRLEQGYIFFDLPELEYEYDDEGLIHRFTLAQETESHKLIENFMLVANEYAAKQLTKLSPTSLYRIHENPDLQKIEKLIELLSHYGISYYDRGSLNASLQYLLNSLPNAEYHKVFDHIILRSMKKAQYSIRHIRHFGLGMETYTHFTSPIRRLCDLVIHQLCKTYLIRSDQVKFNSEQMKHFASVASEQELLADQAERDIERVYSMAYMKKFIGERFSGMVVSAKSAGLIIRLDQIPVNGFLKVEHLPRGRWLYKDKEMRFVNPSNSDYFQLLDKVLVQIMEVSDDIYLELQNVKNAHQHADLLPAKKTPAKSRKSVDYKTAHKKSVRASKKLKRKR
ncbi:MAG: VacB/RNase II family 3'-5' exoribonuclease [Candidatus Cloacimonadaceae bacterium]|nr:VacB/RNase II family 3'-5' exoribonuclease [Candidatus Cloacimonadota bacterium]MDX9949596.1 VacB/RNase II family 3'-5' exoribonuclease [Candidatus Syntrophosphaera sp.]